MESCGTLRLKLVSLAETFWNLWHDEKLINNERCLAAVVNLFKKKIEKTDFREIRENMKEIRS